MKTQIGETLAYIRTKKGIRLETLSRGLCTPVALHRYENGMRVPDRLIFQTLLQRMGVSPDKFLTTVSAREYSYFSWKRDILCRIQTGKWKEAKMLLEDTRAEDRSCNQILQRQFHLLCQGIIEQEYYNNQEKGQALLREAIELTVPGFTDGTCKEIRLSTLELNMVLLYLEKEGRRGRYEVAQEGIEQVRYYVEYYMDDAAEKAKILPRIAGIYMTLLRNEVMREERVILVRQAIELLVKNRMLGGLPELMEHLLGETDYLDSMERSQLEKQRKALLELFQEYGVEYHYDYSGLGDARQEIYLLNEVLYNRRMERGISQEKLSEGICAPETYSRIESGKQTPSNRVYEQINQKLNMEWGHYQALVDTWKMELLEKAWKLDLASANNDLKQMEQLLQELKAGLDLNLEQNHQYVTMQENSYLYRVGKIDAKELLERDQSIIKNIMIEGSKGRHLYNRLELILLNHVAISYRRIGKLEKAIGILSNIITRYKESGIELYENANLIGAICNNLGKCYVESQEYNMAMECAQLGVTISLKNLSGNGALVGCLMLQGFVMEQLYGLNDKSRHKYEIAYYNSDLLKNEGNKKIVEAHYCERYVENMIWYEEKRGD